MDEFGKIHISVEMTWVGYSTFVQCPEEYKEWINFYVQKSSELNGLRRLIGSLER